MKKLLLTILALVLILLVGCGKAEFTGEPESTDAPEISDTEAPDTTSAPDTTVEESESETESETLSPDTSVPADTETLPPPVEIQTPKEMFVTINEVCSQNKTIFADKNSETPDWIELYNSSDRAVNLAGYGISDDPEVPFRYTFTNYLIEAGSHVLLLASGNVSYNAGVISLPFKLSSSGETITLTAPDGLSDSLTFPELGEDEAYGRVTDGGDLVAHLTPTPMATNNSAVTIIRVPKPEFSHVSGFYSERISLSITVPGGCLVYYTTDGSTPTTSSSLYISPLELSDATDNPNVYSAIGGNTTSNFITKNNQEKANVIRAVAIDSDGNRSAVVTSSYFIFNETLAHFYEDMAVLSICTDAENLFDYEKGVYVLGKIYDDYMNGPDFNPDTPTWSRPANYFMEGIEAERPVHIEFFDDSHAFAFGQDAGFRIGGNTSQSSPQKTFKFYARSEYGKSSFDYDFFGTRESCDTFMMRTGANDYAKTKIRDVLAQTLVSDRDFATQGWRPCAMFLNGEYWGFYMLMERYDADYFEDHFGVAKENVIAIKTGEVDQGLESDIGLYGDLRRFAKNNDLTLPENYEKLCSMIDMQSYIDYICFNLIISNHDWPGNNTELWRTREIDPANPYADGRWRWVSYDTERCMLLYGSSGGESYDSNTYERLMNNGIIFKYVYKNQDFAAQFLQTLADMLIYNFDADVVDGYLTYFEENYSLQMQRNRNRYNTTSNFAGELDVIRGFWEKRAEYLLKFTDEIFGCGRSLEEMIVRCDKTEGGSIMLFDHELAMVDGRYILHVFKDTEVTLRAVPAEGYRFVGWGLEDGRFGGGETELSLTLEESSQVVAVFEKLT